jgi:hypothetical protein
MGRFLPSDDLLHISALLAATWLPVNFLLVLSSSIVLELPIFVFRK